MDRTTPRPHIDAPSTDAGAPSSEAQAPTRSLADLDERQPRWCDQRLAASVERTLADWNGRDDVWLFAYGSLIWNPGFDVAESQCARIHGLHRSLCLWSTINRGTVDCPGLVLALDAGGSCEGLVLRVRGADVPRVFCELWKREMGRGSYVPTWVSARTSGGTVLALAFVMNRRLATYAGRLDDAAIVDVLRRACGRFGTTAEYVRRTAEALRAHGLGDARLDRLVARFDAECRAGRAA